MKKTRKNKLTSFCDGHRVLHFFPSNKFLSTNDNLIFMVVFEAWRSLYKKVRGTKLGPLSSTSTC